ncbi:hypothetical protein POM88_027278 [Heracleum sosnowskyi]|uniref:Rad60/SUMO-like domain-containing protein n=1 Tax=Heracleum sosnowskyi TaxID=360622 RepID=A0AAD8I8P1_9APIA|nr:hypothetical protein POM88_027278 [Heracleum sosnowskyi]
MEGTTIKKEDEVTITLKVQKEGTRHFYHTMKRDEPLQNLMIAFCQHRQLGHYRSLRFHVDGDRVRGYHTPKELQLDNGYVIDAWSEEGTEKEILEFVTLKVKRQGCQDYFCTLKCDEPLEKLMISFCQRYDLGDYKTIQFLKGEDGSRIQGHQTPNQVELENEDVIDAWVLSSAGASSHC